MSVKIEFKLHIGSYGNALATLYEQPAHFEVGDVVCIKHVDYRVIKREWQVAQAGHDCVTEECSLVVWVRP